MADLRQHPDLRPAELQRRLAATVAGEVAFDPATRALYAMDASNYRQVPAGVVFPRDAEDVIATVEACRAAGVPVTPRGRGTSIAGNAIGPGVTIDNSRHFNRILDIDPDRRTARVEPGVVLDDLQAALAPHGLRFGPDPSTHNRCTIGGMIGNNACGSHSVAWGKTAENIEELEVLTADGTRMTVGGSASPDSASTPSGRAGYIHAALRQLASRHLAALRTEYTSIPRQVSGYSLHHLLPENGFQVARALVGSEGTCVTVLSATLRLVPLPAAKVLLVASFPDEIAAADAVPAVLAHRPLTVEGMNDRLVAISRGKQGAGASRVTLPDGGGWLLIEMAGDTPAQAAERAKALVADLGAPHRLVEDAGEQRAFWRLREEGSGTLTRLPDGAEAWPGWEDAAVAPENLGSYLRNFSALMAAHGRQGVVYGHFGEGCLHVRIDFDLISEPGREEFRRFSGQLAELIVKHGGSLSGEHGDGLARSEMLPAMYSPELISAFGEFKAIWDPGNLMNPGKIVDPLPIDENLRFHTPPRRELTLAFSHDGGSIDQAARRCVGVGKCVVREPTGVMCPSYAVTGQEMHSTRGRAHLLSEMLRGETITSGWRSPEVAEALDLCLSCKGCVSDCPVDVDMASYKSEFLQHHYAGRVRPASHYSMGWLPVWSRLASLVPGAVNAIGQAPGLSVVVKRVAGVARERSLPRFARVPFTAVFRAAHRRRGGTARCTGASGDGPRRGRVVLWPDSFNNYLTPQVLRDATDVLADAGFEVVLPRGHVCCGLTWITTGQLGVARRVVEHAARVLEPYLAEGLPVVALEPSCAAALRADVTELLPEADPVRRLAQRTVTLAELLSERAPDWRPGELDVAAITQTHCHQHAVLGFDADEQLLARAGVRNRTLNSGCCGLAGNFGFERGHYDISQRIGERVLLPEVRAADADTLVVADGFSCRTQVQQGTPRQALHLAQVLARAIRARR